MFRDTAAELLLDRRPEPPPPRDLPPLSIYHQAWWLDIAVDGAWGEATVSENGVVVGRMPYLLRNRFTLTVSGMTSLIRTLGPSVAASPGKPVAALRRRLAITEGLIDALPPMDGLDQLFDPRVPDAVSFLYRGFTIGETYAMRVESDLSPEALWGRMNDKTRNVIRKAEKTLKIRPIDDVGAFVRFHDEQLDHPNFHGTDRLHRLLTAMLDRQAGSLTGAWDAAGQLVAAAAIPQDDRMAYHLISARRPGAPAGASSLLIWDGMRAASAQGLAFDLDGIVSRTSLQFLSGFGASLTRRLRVRRQNRRHKIASKLLRLCGQEF